MISTGDLKKATGFFKKEYGVFEKAFLDHKDSFQLLIAVILSAQCTDRMVNSVTPGLFARFPDALSLAKADDEELMSLIKSTGFFRNKAASIKKCAGELVARFEGAVPGTMEDLVTLPGVGRKTANVVLQCAFGKSVGVVVDTHVKRLSQRIGFSAEDDPEKIESDLMRTVPEKEWVNFSYWLISHGRKVCDAKAPHCGDCGISGVCGYFRAAQRDGKSDGAGAARKKKVR